ncbi:MAG TPA: metallophosphoesterase [Gaiellaceae bacterium]|nr:metallophosphoesterase [Gaiellaceae bacterium]
MAAWSLFESQWMERRETAVPIPGLRASLDGFRILHLSDLHLGTLSLGGRALDRAVAWAREARPDLVAVSGDLVTRRGGKAKLEDALAGLEARFGVFAVLGNHDVDDARDPFTRPTDLSDLHEAGAVLLRDDERMLAVDGARVQLVGVDPASYKRGASRPAARAAPDADVRILLCHYPDVVRTLPPGVFDLVLAGHLHGGQICVPTPWGKLRLKDLRATHWDGLVQTPAGLLHVSRGLGTTFVPFRFLARPEATLLRLTRAK